MRWLGRTLRFQRESIIQAWTIIYKT